MAEGWRLGEWSCGHGRCPVQRLRLRLGAQVQPPRLRCPLCLRRLEFGGWWQRQEGTVQVANCRSPASPSPGTM
jgi:hypothetical protein